MSRCKLHMHKNAWAIKDCQYRVLVLVMQHTKLGSYNCWAIHHYYIMQGDSLLRWSTHTLAQFQSSFTRLELLASSSSLPQELKPEEREARLWEQLQAKGVLLSNKQLGEKYEKMGKDKMEEEGSAILTALEEEGEREGEGSSLQERKITE